MKDNSLIRKIKNCLRLAEDKGATEAEADTAMKMAKNLIAKNNLSMAEIVMDEDNDTSPWEMEGVELAEPKMKYESYERNLFSTVQMLCDVKVMAFGNHYMGYKMVALGDSQDVAVANAICQWLLKTVKENARKLFGPDWGPSHISYAEGFTRVTESRASEKSRAFEDEKEQESVELVVQNKKDWLAEQLKDVKIKEALPIEDSQPERVDAFFMGANDGRSVSLNHNELEASDEKSID